MTIRRCNPGRGGGILPLIFLLTLMSFIYGSGTSSLPIISSTTLPAFEEPVPLPLPLPDIDEPSEEPSSQENSESSEDEDRSPDEESAEETPEAPIPPPEEESDSSTEDFFDPSAEQQEELPLPMNTEEDYAIVFTYFQLEAALKSGTVTHIYLGDNITMTSGIQVNGAKPSLLISGMNPEDPDQEAPWTLTDTNSGDQIQTIYIDDNNGALKSVTIQDLQVAGRNHHGFFSVYDGVKNFQIVYQNVNYAGPQMTFNRYGKAHYENCTISIGKYGSPDSPGEVGEVPSVRFSGVNHISQAQSQGNEIFYFAFDAGEIIVEDEADVTIQIHPDGDSGLIFAAQAASLTVGRNASFRFFGTIRVWEVNPFSDILVKEGGALIMHTSRTLANYMVRVEGSLTVKEGGMLHLSTDASNNSVLLLSNAKGATFYNPRSVLLYHPGSRPLAYNIPGLLDLTARQVNYWTAAGTGDFNDPPLYSWRKSDGSLLHISGQVAGGTAGNFTDSMTTNFADGDLPLDTPPTPTTFNLVTARVIAFGDLPLEAYYEVIGNESLHIIGSTEGEALLKADYTYEETTVHLADSQADDQGLFSIPVGAYEMPGDALARVRANRWHLYEEAILPPYEGGLLFLEKPDDLGFASAAISPFPQIIQRTDPDWSIVVYDTRGAGYQWTLTARLQSPLTPDDTIPPHVREPLPRSLLLRQNGDDIILSTSSDTFVYHHTNTQFPEQVTLRWPGGEGLLLQVAPGQGAVGGQYSGVILWTITDGP